MTLFTKESLDELKQEVDLERVCDALGMIVADNTFYYICPFCEHESFATNSETESYYCFNCEAKGDALALLLTWKKLTFEEAVKCLALLFNVELEEINDKKEESNKEEEKERKELTDCVSSISEEDFIKVCKMYDSFKKAIAE